MNLTLQTTAGTYQLIKVLGTGEFGSVWQADDLQRHYEVALKLLHHDHWGENLERFREEFSILTTLRHTHLARVLDFGLVPESKQYFFTSELVAGKDFETAMRGREYAYLEEALAQILSALDYIHGEGIIHCDIKASNILVQKQGDHPLVKLVDFGMATRRNQDHKQAGGTLATMAPEVLIRSEKIDHRADLYSLGMLLLNGLTGRWPFNTENPHEVIDWHLHGNLPDNFWGDTPPPSHLQEIALKLLRKRPADRFSQARTVLNFLNLATQKRYASTEQPLHIPEEGPLVEREQLLEKIEQNLREVKNRSNATPSFLVIHGERGIGKSRMMAEIRYNIQIQDIPLIQIECRQGSNTWALLEQKMAALGPDNSKPSLPLPSTPSPELTADHAHWPIRQRTHDLITLATQQPLCILLDDFQWADPETIELISWLEQQARWTKRQGKGLPLFVLMATEDHPPQALPLKRLTLEGIAHYLALVLGPSELIQKMAQKLSDYSGGLPFLMVAGLRYLATTGFANLTNIQLPSSQNLSLLNQEHLQKLAPEQKKLLFFLALLGRPITISDLFSLTKIQGIESYLKKPLQQGLVLHNQQQFVWISSQALALELANSMSEKTKYHHLIATFLEQQASNPPEELAAHWSGAGERAKALDHYQAGASQLIRSGNYASATHCLIKALPLCEPGSETERVKLKLVNMLIYLGRYPEAEQHLKDILAEKNPTAEELAGWLAFKQRNFTQAWEHYERAATYLKPHETVRSLTLQNSLGNVALQRDDTAQAVQIFEASRRQEQALPQIERILISNNNLGLAYSQQGAIEPALSFLQERLALCRQQDLTDQVILVHSALGYVLLKAGRYAEAITALEEGLRCAEQTGILHPVFTLLGNLITASLKSGHYATALSALQKMRSYQERLGTLRDLAFNQLRQASLYLILGIPEAAQQNISQGKDLATEIGDAPLHGWLILMQGYLAKDLGLLSEARQHFATACTQGRQSGSDDLTAWSCYALADLSQEEGNFASCRQWLQEPTIAKLRDEEFETRVALLQAKLSRDSFAPLEQRCHELHLPELLWEVYHAWAHAERQCGKTAHAITLLEKGVGVLNTMIHSLPEEYRDRYLEQRYRKSLFEEYQSMAGPVEPGLVFAFGKIIRTSDPKQEETSMSVSHNLSVLLEINKRMVTEHDPDRLLEFIMDIAIELSGAEQGLLLLLVEQGAFETRIARNINKEDLEVSRFSHSIAQQVVKTGRPIFSLNTLEDENLNTFKSVVTLGLKTVACVPLRILNQTKGVIYLDTQQRSAPLEKDILPLLEAFADQAALALQNALSFQAKEQDRQRLAQDLSQSQKVIEAQEIHLHELETLVSRTPRKTLYPYDKIIGGSKKMEELLKTMDKITNAQVSVFIHGETGTGKELVARALHQNSLRKGRSFVAINCSAFTENILESELFGCLKGAFTGADRDRKGLFEEADQGTLFLDEVADMSLTMQAKVLRAVQEQEIMRVGGRTPIKVQVRIVAASNKDLKQLVREGRFREDLYFRIAGITLLLPPLRERREDIPLLIKHFLDKIKSDNKLSGKLKITRESIHLLMNYSWPGNIRELEQCLTSAVLLRDGDEIRPQHLLLQRELYQGRTPMSPPPTGEALIFHPDKTMLDYEREILLKTLETCEGNKSEAARRLGLSRLTLHKKLKSYDH